jgi:Flp pilus assembly protein TadD
MFIWELSMVNFSNNRSSRPWAKALTLAVLAASLVVVSGQVLAADVKSGPGTGDRLSEARKFIDAKEWSKAMFELNEAVRDEPRNADVHNLLGYTYRKRATPDLAKAFEHYNTALKINPKHKGAHEYIGEAYLMDKKPAEAEKHLAQLEVLCGNKTCEEYADLAKAIADYKTKN